MIKRRNVKGEDQVRLTFALSSDDPRLPASVVGDFNGWDPAAHPLQPRSNNTHSAIVTLERDRRYLFRYRGADGTWFNDDEAEALQPNQHGSQDCIVTT